MMDQIINNNELSTRIFSTLLRTSYTSAQHQTRVQASWYHLNKRLNSIARLLLDSNNKTPLQHTTRLCGTLTNETPRASANRDFD